jgi:hypothetical protein
MLQMLQGVHWITAGSGVDSMLSTHLGSMQGHLLRCTAVFHTLACITVAHRLLCQAHQPQTYLRDSFVQDAMNGWAGVPG